MYVYACVKETHLNTWASSNGISKIPGADMISINDMVTVKQRPATNHIESKTITTDCTKGQKCKAPYQVNVSVNNPEYQQITFHLKRKTNDIFTVPGTRIGEQMTFINNYASTINSENKNDTTGLPVDTSNHQLLGIYNNYNTNGISVDIGTYDKFNRV